MKSVLKTQLKLKETRKNFCQNWLSSSLMEVWELQWDALVPNHSFPSDPV